MPCKGCKKNKKKHRASMTPEARAARTIASPREDFERVYVVNLERRPDRWQDFQERLPKDWPFRTPERFNAIDGKKCQHPEWWHQGGGAWGCYRSHLRLIEQCLMDGVQSVLLLEDDALVGDDFAEKSREFMAHLPEDWEFIYLGGQHLGSQKHPPLKVNDWVYRPWNVNRTHAFALRGDGLRKVYRWLNATKGWRNKHHVDHHLGRLHQRRDMPIYCPKEWLVAQGENRSNIAGRTFPTRFWKAAEALSSKSDDLPDFVAVVGLHRSGSSCIASCLHKLGIHLGNKLGGYEKTGGGEAAGLAAICERAAKFPAASFTLSQERIESDLRGWITDRRREAKERGTLAGGKYPHLCAMLPMLVNILGPQLKVIHIDRPLEESIASLCRRSKEVKRGWLHVTDEQSAAVQRWLWEEKQEWLPQTDHHTVSYDALLRDPWGTLREVVKFLGIKPTDEQWAAATGHVDAGQRHIQPKKVASE